MSTDVSERVTAMEKALCQRVGEARFQLWFADKTKWTWHNDLVVVGVPNHFYQEWLQKAFADDIRAAAGAVFGQPLDVRFVIDPELFQAARRREIAPGSAPPPGARGPQEEDHRSEEHDQGDFPLASPTVPSVDRKSWGQGTTGLGRRGQPHSRRWRRLEEFVVGPCNRVAYASAQSVVEAPGQDANPLVLHGPVGTGKTHLLEGIRAGLRQTWPDRHACYVTAEEFTHRFVQAMRLGKLGAFRKSFREADALLLDDLNFLATKPATQEEFLHTLDHFLAEGRQVVVSCDCHPRLTDQFQPELTDRLLGGAVWALQPPEAQTRLDLLRAKAGAAVPADVLAYLAAHLHGNVREIEGALHSLEHFRRVTGRPLDLSLAREVLSDLLRHSIRLVQLADVERAVCLVLRLDSGALHSKKRGWSYSHPRMLAMYLARKHTGASYTDIGQCFGRRNHSTAVAAEKKVRQWLQDDGQLHLGERPLRVRDVLERIERELLK